MELSEILLTFSLIGLALFPGMGIHDPSPIADAVAPTSSLSVLAESPSNSDHSSADLVVGLSIAAGIVVWVIIGVCALIFVLCCICFIFCRKSKRKMRNHKLDDRRIYDVVFFSREFLNGMGPRKFSFHELAKATSNFKDKQKLGEGGFGAVYKGYLRDLGTYVAVERVSKASKQGIKEYLSEVKIISRLLHKNLVNLIGWCHENGELILVYEFMANGSLDSHLFKGKSLLTWDMRYQIVQDLASALFYLHVERDRCVLHRDIKTSDIMLDSKFKAKLGDFGLARLVDHSKGSQATLLAGTIGYMAPECFSSRKASKQSDVYRVVILEIACGRIAMEDRYEGNSQVSLAAWVWELYGKERLIGAADKRLCMGFDCKQMECLLMVGLWCAHPNHNLRPSMRQAVQVLHFEAPLPNLSGKMPIPSYDDVPRPASEVRSSDVFLSNLTITIPR